jgi:hypothetical protein
MTFDKRFVEDDPETLIWSNEPITSEEKEKSEYLIGILSQFLNGSSNK